MKTWGLELRRIAEVLVGRESPVEMWGLIAVCALLICFVYPRISIRLGGRGRLVFFSLFPGLFILLAAPATVAVFTDWHPLYQALAALLAFLFLVVPLTGKLEKLPYFHSFLVWSFCIALVAGLLTAEMQVKSVVDRGREEGARLKERLDTVNEYVQ